ncbi:transposase [Ilyomonas limi]|uniref:Transposase n=1 Tax=Ilyomonas limi TaxID=2575867 RepID=A0A4U3KWT1_9BACT|nr:transposase [Ilyomonas limi]
MELSLYPKDFGKRAYDKGVTLDYSRPNKSTDNLFVESFNGLFRDECRNIK